MIIDYRLSIRDKGFTLIEAVVAISIFAMTITGIVGVYLSLQRLNETSASVQALQQNGRFITENITKIIRNGKIDYDRYVSTYGPNGAPQPSTSDLFLIDQDGVSIRIYRSGNDLLIDKSGAGVTTLSGKEIRILTFSVYVWPRVNPFPGGIEQPTATVFMNLESNIYANIRSRLPFQVTAASREYPQ